MIVRELLAIFGIDYDGKGQRQAEKGIATLTGQANQLQQAMGMVGQALAGAGVAKVLLSTVHAASALQEAEVRVGALFGQSAEQVRTWGNAAAKELGLGTGTLSQMVSEMGAVAKSFAGSDALAAELATTLSTGAVNMARFFGVDTASTVSAIQQGMLGMDRQLKRFGISLSEATLEEYLRARGIRKSLKAMSEQEKMLLKARVLQQKLNDYQGAGNKALNRAAGATQALRERWTDLRETLGLGILPAFTWLVNAVRRGLESFMELTKGTNLIKAAMFSLTGAMLGLLIPVLANLLIAAGPLLVAFTAFVFIMDDVITTLEGGTSVLGEFTKLLDSLQQRVPGVGGIILRGLVAPLNLLRWILGTVGGLAAALFESLESGSFTPLKRAVQALGDELSDLLTHKIRETGKALGKITGMSGATIAGGLASVQQGAGNLSVDDLRAIAVGGAEGVGRIVGTARSIATGVGQTATDIAAGHGVGTALTNVSNTFNISQQAGESGEAFARRVAEIVDAKAEERDIALAHELTQGAVP